MVDDKLKYQVELIHALLMPDLNNMEAVIEFLKRAPEAADPSIKDYVTTLCEGYLKEL
jgi:hypothetical protein